MGGWEAVDKSSDFFGNTLCADVSTNAKSDIHAFRAPITYKRKDSSIGCMNCFR